MPEVILYKLRGPLWPLRGYNFFTRAILWKKVSKLIPALAQGRSPSAKGIPYKVETCSLVLFYLPYLVRLGKNSWMFQKYGCLDKNSLEGRFN